MRSILFSLLLFFAFGEKTFAQPKECKDCIEWKEGQRLKWSDFKGTPKRSFPEQALTDSGMSLDLQCDNNTSKIVVKCFFNRTRSWTKDQESAYLLAHEQLHFDITELFVRKLRKRLAQFGNNCKQLNEQVEKHYNGNYKEFVAYQDAYDNETDHSINKEKQAFWEEKVATELEELRTFSTLTSN